MAPKNKFKMASQNGVLKINSKINPKYVLVGHSNPWEKRHEAKECLRMSTMFNERYQIDLQSSRKHVLVGHSNLILAMFRRKVRVEDMRLHKNHTKETSTLLILNPRVCWT